MFISSVPKVVKERNEPTKVVRSAIGVHFPHNDFCGAFKPPWQSPCRTRMAMKNGTPLSAATSVKSENAPDPPMALFRIPKQYGLYH